MTTRELQAEENRRKILSCALEEFGTHGYHSASTNAICRCAGLSKGLLYHYFPTKEMLFLQVLEHCVNDLEAISPQPPPASPGTSSFALQQFCTSRLEFFLLHPHHNRVLEELLRGDFDIAEFAPVRQKLWQNRRLLLERHLSQASLRPSVRPEDAAELLLMVLDQLRAKYLPWREETVFLERETVSLHLKESEQLLQLLLYGILEPPNQPQTQKMSSQKSGEII